MKWLSRVLLTTALLLNATCGSETDVARTTLDLAKDPAGESAKVVENAMHATHLSGTTPLTCSQCHDFEASEFKEPARDRCVSCHPANQVALHGDEITCTDCHAFAAGDASTKEDCQHCHKDPQKKHMAIKAHAKIDCRNCHVSHGEPKLAIKTCVTCHEDHQEGHGKPENTLVERCSECHLPHTKSIEAVTRCQGCHEDKLRSAVFRGHNKCDTCHQGNTQSAPPNPIICASCHGGRVTMASNKVKEHNTCTSCHAPHDPRGTAVQSCRRCHSGVAPKHPASAKSGRCIGCHAPHPKAAEVVVAACSSCHRQARADDALHAPQRTKCSQCHKPHDFKVAACASCHQRQTGLTSTASGHAKCASCHEKPHAPKPTAKTCSGCHVSEYDTANSGHQDCTKCHEPHSGKRLAKARCESCHAERLGMIHGRIDGGCTNCHRPHGPGGRAKPPACTTCHARKRLPGLHAVDDHNNCSTCHKGHSMGALGRSTCMVSCHEDKTDHESVAKTCVGCHPFGGSR